jgi:hypothetical protein
MAMIIRQTDKALHIVGPCLINYLEVLPGIFSQMTGNIPCF